MGFFSSPRNLASITPPKMGFEIRMLNLAPRIYPAKVIACHVRQYALWHHEDLFRDIGGGRVETEARITYVLPLSPFSEIVHSFLVKPQLDQIFAFREKAVLGLFPE